MIIRRVFSWSSGVFMFPALCACHLSNASQSSSLLTGSQRSPSGPSPCHRTRYCIPVHLWHSSMILSTIHSSFPSMFTGFSGCRARVPKRKLLFSWNSFTSDVWKTGKRVDLLGSTSICVECFSSVAMTVYRPSNWGMNLAMHGSSLNLYLHYLCAVERTMCSPSLKGNVNCQCAFSC